MCSYQLKFDDRGVYSQMHGGKEHIDTILDVTELLNHCEIQFMTINCQASPFAQMPL